MVSSKLVRGLMEDGDTEWWATGGMAVGPERQESSTNLVLFQYFGNRVQRHSESGRGF